MRKILFLLSGLLMISGVFAQNTLLVYYSYTNNVRSIVNELSNHLDVDIVEILPAEEGLRYEADNYAIGSALISAIRDNPDDAESYPAIKPVDIDFSRYDNIIIATPLWWSNMAAPMQSFLFQNGDEMGGKNVSLIVSSASSGISSVVADAKRLIPDGNFIEEALWINNNNRSNMPTLLEAWIRNIKSSKYMTEKLSITVGNTTYLATLVDNRSTQALVAALKESPITYKAQDYGNFEKVGSLGRTFPTNNEETTTEPGDIVLYNGNQMVIFYGTNSWSYTRLGKIDNITVDQLKNFLGDGDCTITLSLSSQSVSGFADTAFSLKGKGVGLGTNKYDLQGREVESCGTGQIYIQNGEKWMKTDK